MSFRVTMYVKEEKKKRGWSGQRRVTGSNYNYCKLYLMSFHSIKIWHIFREVNGVANRLAQVGGGPRLGFQLGHIVRSPGL